jgi:hypothetical protein
MIELTFRYEPEHLKAYQRLASRRVKAKNTDYEAAWWRWMFLYTMLAAAVLAGAYLAFPELTGRPFALLEFACGFVAGVAVSFAMAWRRYQRLSGKVVKSDGPTMSEHRVSVAEDGIRSTSRMVDHVYRWSAFEGVTVHDGVIVLWTDPGAGALVPRSAFAGPAEEKAFIDTVWQSITEGRRGAQSTKV